MDLPLLKLDSPGTASRAEVGGKAAPLTLLADAGLPVPPGVILPRSAFRWALADAGLLAAARAVSSTGSSGDAASLHRAILSMPLPQGWSAALARAVARLGGRVAVRSSGVDEDGAKRSFAGQHHTSLHVGPDDVEDAVRACWASLYAPEALAYRGSSGPAIAGMAVLIQQMIEPRTAGVLFTIDPVSGSWREMVVEAVWGTGEPLVSGRVAPHWFRVRRPRRLPRGLSRLAGRIRLRVIDSALPSLPGGEGPTLSPSRVTRLCRLGLRVERRFGGPQDIEWAEDAEGRFWILQSRPVTTGGQAERRRDVLWTRRFVGERWPEPATPLGWSLMHPLLEHFIAYPEVQQRYLGGGPSLRLVQGRPYVNATIFRHLAFKLPGRPPPSFMAELVPPDEEAAWRRQLAMAPDLSVYAAVLRTTWRERRWERFEWNPLTNPIAWERYRAQLAAALPRISRTPSDPEDGLRLVDRHIELVRTYIGVHVCSLLFANLTWQLLDGALSEWLPDRSARLMDALATCPPGNRTLETNDALWTLAHQLDETHLEQMEAGHLPEGVAGAAVRTFLASYGHRSEASWEVMAPRWRAHPERLAPLLRLQQRSPTRPGAMADAAEETAGAARAEIEDQLQGARHAAVDLLIHHTRRYLLLRENQRFWFDRLLDSLQRVLLWCGDELVRRGELEVRDDVAFVTWPELRDTLSGEPCELETWVRRRREAHAANQQDVPPAFIRGDDAGPPPAEALRLQGLAVSPGRARGRVRVVRSPTEATRLQPGEILVASAVDPGWTPLFSTAAGVVLELGSVLSHGAVVAREYGLPCVVNVDRVMQRLHDGQEVTIDGTRGTVFVHP